MKAGIVRVLLTLPLVVTAACATGRPTWPRYTPDRGGPLFKLEPGYSRVGTDRPRLFISGDGSAVACAYQLPARKVARLMINGQVQRIRGRLLKVYKKIMDVVLSHQGDRFMVSSHRRPTWLTHGSPPMYVNVDGARVGPLAIVDHMGFSRDSRHASFTFEDLQGREGIWLDGRRYYQLAGKPRMDLDGIASFATRQGFRFERTCDD